MKAQTRARSWLLIGVLVAHIGVVGCQDHTQDDRDTGGDRTADWDTSASDTPGPDIETTTDTSSGDDADPSDVSPDVADTSDGDTSLDRPNWGHDNDIDPTLVARRRGSVITVDGRLDEQDYRLAMRYPFDDPSGESDNTADYRAIWDDDHLYIAANITDGSIEYDESRKAFENDSAEISLDPRRDRSYSLESDDLHLFGLPKADSIVKRGGSDGFETDPATELEAAATTDGDGYTVEMRLAWDDLGIEPETHRRLGIALAVNDRDGPDRVQFSWDPSDSLLEPSEWGDLRLGPSTPASEVPEPDDSPPRPEGCSYEGDRQPDVSRTINLGDEGLSPGDNIDPYLDQYVESGNKVVIPDGTYDWSGSIGGDFDDDTVLCGKGRAILQAPDGNDHHGTFDVGNGALLRLMNLTFEGVASAGKNRIAFQATSRDAHIQVINVRHPDGSPHTGHPSPIGFYVRTDHVGRLLFKNSYIANFPNNGIYAGHPDGEVVVDGCVFEGNRVDNLRMSDNDVVRNTLIKMNGGTYNYAGRGIRFRYPGEMTLENVHIVNDVGASPIQTATPDRVGGDVDATLRDVFIENNTGATPIDMKIGSAQADNVHITGSGDLSPNGVDGDVCTGSNCTAPKTDITQIRP